MVCRAVASGCHSGCSVHLRHHSWHRTGIHAQVRSHTTRSHPLPASSLTARSQSVTNASATRSDSEENSVAVADRLYDVQRNSNILLKATAVT